MSSPPFLKGGDGGCPKWHFAGGWTFFRKKGGDDKKGGDPLKRGGIRNFSKQVENILVMITFFIHKHKILIVKYIHSLTKHKIFTI